MNYLTLDQLRVLDAIEELGTFAQAAASLHRVPSAVSYAVRSVEEAVGFPIFDRSARKARFTPEGKRLLEEGRALLEQARRLEALTDRIRTGWESELHVVVDGALPMGPVLRSLKAFSDPAVPTRLRLDIEYKEGVLHRFHSDRAQLMLLIGFDSGEDTSSLELVPLPPLTMCLVAGAQYGLAPADGLELSVRDSSPAKARGVGSFSGGRDVAFLTDFHAKRIALLEGVGFGWMPRHLIDADLAAGRLVRVVVDGPSEWVYKPQIARRRGQELGRGAELFLSHLA